MRHLLRSCAAALLLLTASGVGAETAIPPAPRLLPEALAGPDLEALRARAQDAYLAGRYEEAARLWIEVVRADPRDPIALYNLACMYGRLGAAENAAAFLYAAWDAGFRNLEHLGKDPDFGPVRGAPAFAETLRRIEDERASQSRIVGEPWHLEAEVEATVQVVAPAEGKGLPLVVALHGRGGNPELFARQLLEGRGEQGAIWAFVQAPYAQRVTGGVGYGWFRMDENLVPEPRTRGLSEALVREVVAKLVESGRVDPKRVYVVGFSQGAFLAGTLALRHPETFRGAAIIGGWIEPSELTPLPKGASRLRMLVLHSQNDPAVRWQQAQATQAFLKKHEIGASLFGYPGGHAVTPQVAERIHAWLKEDAP